jgi:hypothetical protein
MIKIINILERIAFLLEEDGTYVGYGNNCGGAKIVFEFKNHFLICTKNDMPLFSIIYADLSIGTFLVLLQEFGIIHHRFIYERVDFLVEQFDDQYGDNNDD